GSTSSWGYTWTWHQTGVRGSLFYAILPQMDNDPLYNSGKYTTSPASWQSWVQVIYDYNGLYDYAKSPNGPYSFSRPKSYLAPGDPTAVDDSQNISYVANKMVFPSSPQP